MNVGEFLTKYQVKIKTNVAVWGVIAFLVVASGYMELMATPGKRMFALDDPSISNPFTLYERYNDVWLLIVAVFIPLMALSGLILVDPTVNDKFHTFYETSLEFSIGVSVTMFLTTFLKIRLGKLRPDFLQRCGASVSLMSNSTISALYDESVCTAPFGKRILMDGYKSCPSGHSSMSVVGLGFVTVWCLKRYTPNSALKPVVVCASFIPLLLALDVVCSRITDFRHSYSDVLTGCLLGMCGLVFTHFVSSGDNQDSVILPL